MLSLSLYFSSTPSCSLFLLVLFSLLSLLNYFPCPHHFQQLSNPSPKLTPISCYRYLCYRTLAAILPVSLALSCSLSLSLGLFVALRVHSWPFYSCGNWKNTKMAKRNIKSFVHSAAARGNCHKR